MCPGVDGTETRAVTQTTQHNEDSRDFEKPSLLQSTNHLARKAHASSSNRLASKKSVLGFLEVDQISFQRSQYWDSLKSSK